MVVTIAFLQQHFVIGLDSVPIANLILPFIVGSILAALVAYFVRKSRRHLLERLKAGRMAAESTVRDSENILATAIDSISDGFLMSDAEDRIILSNNKFRKLYPNSHDLIYKGAKLEDFLRGGAERGEYPEAVDRVDDWLAHRMAEIAKNVSVIEERLIGDRWVRAAARRLSDGRRVSVHVDFTEIK